MAVIECVELSKTYSRRVTALNNLTLIVDEGTSFGLLGENGAGKSTLVRIIMGFIFPSSGSVRVFGEKEIARAHARIGYVHERPIFENRFTGRAYLTYLGQLSGLWDQANKTRVDSLLEQVNLHQAADRAIGTYSKGMLQRLAIAQSLLTEPELLILDEPTSGLDPHSQWEIRQIISALRKQGKTILICSHYLTEIEELCDAVGIMRRGSLLLTGKVTDLIHTQNTVEIVLAGQRSATDVVEQLNLAELVIKARANQLNIASSAQSQVLSALVRANIPITSLNPVSHTLEEVYINAVQKPEQPAKVVAGMREGGKR
ncbi:MAG TPA: ABC transporter ATP-binding protein [Ktedonosporobacter sp.]|nr:ABC transporter ATP-binding protein [Ktedonosporobacter sp.]